MTNNTQTPPASADSKARKKARLKRSLLWIFAVLAVLAVVVIILLAMLLHTPSYYEPLRIENPGVMSVYLTNYLLPVFYNNVQYQQPFDMVITQTGINDVVARFKWPKKFGSVDVYDPAVFLTPAGIVVMATISFDDTELVTTVVAEPEIDADGLLSLHVSAVNLGAVEITPFAKSFAADLYQKNDKDSDSFQSKAVRSMLYDEPFDPYFQIDDKKVRLYKVTLKPKELTLHIAPVLDENINP